MASHLYLIQTERLDGSLLPGVEMHAESPNGPWAGVTNPCGQFAPSLAAGAYSVDFFLNGQKIGHRDWVLGDPPQSAIRVGLDAGSALGPQGQTIQRAPLPPFPQPVDYATTLLAVPPQRDLFFYRGNFCGMHIPGAPVVPGCNADHPDVIMACLLDNYPREIQDRYLDAYVAAGYTHLQRSLGHAIYHGHSGADYIDLSARARARGLFCDHWFLSGPDEYPGCKDQTVDYWRGIFAPIIPELLATGVVDTACVGWQLDAYNQPGNVLIQIIQYIAEALPRSVPLYTHWMNEALAWWKTGGEVWTDKYQTINVTDRFSWWAAMQPYLTGGHHQGSNQMALADPKQYQDRLCDTLDCFGGDTGKGNMGKSQRDSVRPFGLTAFEVTAQFQFDGQCTEAYGDMAGYLTLCTRSHTGLPMAGYGNGARRPDGSPL